MSLGKRAYFMARAFVNTEFERIKGVDRELAEQELNSPVVPKPRESEPKAVEGGALTKSDAYRILGVEPSAPFSTIRTAYEKLFERADPTKFAADKDAQVQATMIRTRISQAYAILCQDQNETDVRFGSLDLS